MFRDIAGGSDNLGLANVVVCEEDDLEQVADIRVVVHDVSNLVDEMNDGLGHPVSWRSLSTEDGDSRSELLPLLWGHGLNLEIPVDDTENVELLTLVLVNTLYLYVEQSRRVDGDVVVLFDVLRESNFVRILDLPELLTELFVVNKSLQLTQQREIFQEVKPSKLRRNQRRQPWVSLMQPSSWRDTVGYIGEFVRSVDLHKVLEDGRLDEIGVELSNTVDLV